MFQDTVSIRESWIVHENQAWQERALKQGVIYRELPVRGPGKGLRRRRWQTQGPGLLCCPSWGPGCSRPDNEYLLPHPISASILVLRAWGRSWAVGWFEATGGNRDCAQGPMPGVWVPLGESWGWSRTRFLRCWVEAYLLCGQRCVGKGFNNQLSWRMYVCACMHAHVYTHMCTYTHEHIPIYTQVCYRWYWSKGLQHTTYK